MTQEEKNKYKTAVLITERERYKMALESIMVCYDANTPAWKIAEKALYWSDSEDS